MWDYSQKLWRQTFGVDAQHRNRRWVLVWWGCPNQGVKVVFETPQTGLVWASSTTLDVHNPEPAGQGQSFEQKLFPYNTLLLLTVTAGAGNEMANSHQNTPGGTLINLDFLSHPGPILLQRQREKMNFSHTRHTSQVSWHAGEWDLRSRFDLLSASYHTPSALWENLSRKDSPSCSWWRETKIESEPGWISIPGLGVGISSYNCTLFHLFSRAELYMNSSWVSDIISAPINSFEQLLAGCSLTNIQHEEYKLFQLHAWDLLFVCVSPNFNI